MGPLSSRPMVATQYLGLFLSISGILLVLAFAWMLYAKWGRWGMPDAYAMLIAVGIMLVGAWLLSVRREVVISQNSIVVRWKHLGHTRTYDPEDIDQFVVTTRQRATVMASGSGYRASPDGVWWVVECVRKGGKKIEIARYATKEEAERTALYLQKIRWGKNTLIEAVSFEQLGKLTRNAAALYHELHSYGREGEEVTPFSGIDYSAPDEGSYFSHGVFLSEADVATVRKEHGFPPEAEQELRNAEILKKAT